MNNEGRVWNALKRETVDRAPIHAVAGNLCNKVLGESPRSAFDMIDDLGRQYPEDWMQRAFLFLIPLQQCLYKELKG